MSAKWVLPLLLVLDARAVRYTDLESALAGISPRALTDKLRLLMDEGLVERIERVGITRQRLYTLTPEGRRAARAAAELAAWARETPVPAQ